MLKEVTGSNGEPRASLDSDQEVLVALERHTSELAEHQAALLQLVQFQAAIFEHSLLPTNLLARLSVLTSRLWRQGQKLEASSAATTEATIITQAHARQRATQREAQQSATPARPAFKAHEVDQWLTAATTAKRAASPPAASAAVVHEQDEGEVARLRTALIAERWKNMQSRIRWSTQQSHMSEEAMSLRQHIKLVTTMYQKLWDARGVGGAGTNNPVRPATATVPTKPSPWNNSEAVTGGAPPPGSAASPRRASTARGARSTACVSVTATTKARCGSAKPAAPSWAVVQQQPPPSSEAAATTATPMAAATATSSANGAMNGAVGQQGGTAGLGGPGNAADVLRSLANYSGGDGDAARQETLGEHALALSLAHAQQLDFVQRTHEQRIKELRFALDAATPRSRIAATASPRAGTAPSARGALPSVTQQITWEEARAAIATTARRQDRKSVV